MQNYRSYYQRHLPHYQPPDAKLFITFRLAGSIPQAVIEQLEQEAERIVETISSDGDRSSAINVQEKRMFGRWDKYLDLANHRPTWVARPEIAKIVADAIQYRDGLEYDLHAYCIMPNHVHMIFQPLCIEGKPKPLARIMQSLKRYTAREANKILKRHGSFWQAESYDHVIRDADEYERILHYVCQNPVKVWLVRHTGDWPWMYTAAQ
jgi:putative transposase